jgi:hypothetical protein
MDSDNESGRGRLTEEYPRAISTSGEIDHSSEDSLLRDELLALQEGFREQIVGHISKLQGSHDDIRRRATWLTPI